MNRKELLVLFTLASVMFTHVLDGMILMPMVPVLKQTLDITTQQCSILISSYGLSAFVSSIIATFWVDHFDRKKVLLFLYIGFLVGTFACGIANSYAFFLAARIFTGLFGGVAGASSFSIAGDVVAQKRTAQGMGIISSGFALASVVGVPAGIYLFEKYSWHLPFYILVALGLVVLGAILLFIPSLTAHISASKSQPRFALYRHIFSSKNRILALLLGMCTLFSHFSIIPYIGDYLVSNLGFSMREDITYTYIVGGALSMIATPLVGKLADAFGKRKVYLTVSALAWLPIYMISNFDSNSLPLLLGVTGLFFVFSGGRMTPVNAIVSSTVSPHYRGGFMSFNSAMQQLSMGLCTLVGGAIITNDVQKHLYNYHIVGYIGIATAFLAMVIALAVKSPKGQDSHHHAIEI